MTQRPDPPRTLDHAAWARYEADNRRARNQYAALPIASYTSRISTLCRVCGMGKCYPTCGSVCVDCKRST